MKKSILLFAGALMLIGLGTTSCKKEVTDASQASSGIAGSNYNLYARVGGTAMVSDPNNGGAMIEQGRLTLRSVVDSTIFLIAEDGDFLTKFFPTLVMELNNNDVSGLNALSESLTDFFCIATGSLNHSYTGLNMEDSHNPAKNSRMGALAANADFDKFIGFVVAGAAENGVPGDNPIVSDLGKLLETLRTTIVQK
ncbi:MAG: hypothetical protein ACI9XP_000274 [Lentimonas sp.]|jgi:hypothetical protein